MEIAKLSSKGQIVIPLKLRNSLGLSEGSVIGMQEVNDVLVIKKIDTDLVDQFEKSLSDLKQGKIKRVA
ncbi:MAG: AbrB/MazE/SpoVT family DNA-binding domain-containing protein [Nanoarchaeota archaeon]|jgi:antitoxin PrlF|nr:AbrB/MazE/SpoVT family DNA-binding domain-containing protein [Nanoarchaeota archaeon]